MRRPSAVAVLVLLANMAWASPRRISSEVLDLSKTHQIELAPGLVSVLEFPHPISEVRLGLPDEVKALISTVNPKELTLYLSHHGSLPTNLIVKAERRVYVFDVLPSKRNHQDFLKVVGAYGSPERTGVIRRISLESPPRKEVVMERLKLGAE